MSEVEVGAFVDLDDVQPLHQDLVGELAWCHQGDVAVEGEDEDGVEAKLFEDAQLDGEWRDEVLGDVWAKDADRMRVEGDDERFGAEFASAPDVLAQDVLMRTVHTVEVADGDDGGTEVSGDGVELAEDQH